MQIIAFSLVLYCVQGKLVEVGYIPASLANPKDVSKNFKQCNQIAFPPKGTTSDITEFTEEKDLSDLTNEPIFFSAYGFTKKDKWVKKDLACTDPFESNLSFALGALVI